jgi:hypothetical protein
VVGRLDHLLQLFRWHPLRLHLSGIEEDAHLRLSSRFIKGYRVENVVSILLQRPSPPERIVARSGNECVEAIRALRAISKPLSGLDIHSRIVSQVRRQRAER